jgi:hypothetical protein
MFPVRYGLNSYINLLRNILSHDTSLVLTDDFGAANSNCVSLRGTGSLLPTVLTDKEDVDASAKGAGLHGDVTFELAVVRDFRACRLVFSCSLFYCAVSYITPDGRMIDE